MFFIAGSILLTIAIVFFFSTGKIKEPKEDKILNTHQNASTKVEKTQTKADKKSVLFLLLLGEFSLVCYAIEGGLQQWVPSVIKENFGLSDSISIFMSNLLPLFTLPVDFISPHLFKLLTAQSFPPSSSLRDCESDAIVSCFVFFYYFLWLWLFRFR